MSIRRSRIIGRLLTTLLSWVILAPALAAQIDIQITQIGPIRTVARNVFWSNSGTAGLNNSYIFKPTYTNETACLYVRNSDTVSHSFVLAWYATGDETVSAYQGNASAWQLIGPSAVTPVNTVGFIALTAGSSAALFSQVQNAARVAILITSGSGVPNSATATLTLVESQNGYGCGNVPTGPVYCPISVSRQVVTGTTVTLLPAVAGEAPYVCSISISYSPALAAAATLQLETGTTANCGTLFAVVWQVELEPSSPLWLAEDGSPGGLVPRYNLGGDNVGQGLCFKNNTADTIYLNATVAQF